MKLVRLSIFFALLSHQAAAQPLNAALSGLGFLLGQWTAPQGQVAETGGSATGTSSFEAVANGGGVLRRDHTNLFDASGKPAGGFDQVMLIYPEAGTLHAEYLDGTHTIHYTQAAIAPGKSAVFSTAAVSGRPNFRLSYTLTAAGTCAVEFAIAPPGQTQFHPIATGTLNRRQNVPSSQH